MMNLRAKAGVLQIRTTAYGEDEQGHSVFLFPGDTISEIEDAGATESGAYYASDVLGWNVSFKLTPKHKLWTETLTMNAVELLKALEGQ